MDYMIFKLAAAVFSVLLLIICLLVVYITLH